MFVCASDAQKVGREVKIDWLIWSMLALVFAANVAAFIWVIPWGR